MEVTRAFPQLGSTPSLPAVPGAIPRVGGALFARGGGPYGSPPSRTRARFDVGENLIGQPPIGEVVGAGAVGALAGTLEIRMLPFACSSVWGSLPQA